MEYILDGSRGLQRVRNPLSSLPSFPLPFLSDTDRAVVGCIDQPLSADERAGCRAPSNLALVSGKVSRSEEHTSELQSLMRISSAVFCLKKKRKQQLNHPRSAQ